MCAFISLPLQRNIPHLNLIIIIEGQIFFYDFRHRVWNLLKRHEWKTLEKEEMDLIVILIYLYTTRVNFTIYYLSSTRWSRFTNIEYSKKFYVRKFSFSIKLTTHLRFQFEFRCSTLKNLFIFFVYRNVNLKILNTTCKAIEIIDTELLVKVLH